MNLQRAASRKFCISRKLLANGGRKAVSGETIKLMEDFYKANSNQLPDKNLVGKKQEKLDTSWRLQ